MSPALPIPFLRLSFLLTVVCCFSITLPAQTWTFRNGFGQSGSVHGLTQDAGRGVCTDASGNVYITGFFNNDNNGNTVSFGGTALVSAGDQDGFVAKYNSSGVFQWSIRFGGTLIDNSYGIATDGTSVYVAGSANGAITVGTSATSYPDVSTGTDGVIMKLDASNGNVTWVTRFGGSSTDEAQAICLDGSGNVYVSGVFRSNTTTPATFGSFTATVQGNSGTTTSDLFVAKLNSSGTFQWVSTGGISGSNDNITGSGICYVPSLSEVVVTGSFRTTIAGSTTATYSTTSPASTVTLTSAGNTVTNEDFCLLEVAASTGAFVTGSSAGGSDGSERGLGITYDSNTGDVFFAGSFASASVTFPGLSAITNGSATHDNIMYGRYNPNTNAYTWVKNVTNSSPSTAADMARAITSNGLGSIMITGNFRNTATFPGTGSLTAASSLADIFVTRVSAATGSSDYALQGSGTSTTADDIGYGIASSSDGNVWINGQYASSITFGSLSALASVSNTEDVVIASYLDIPSISVQPVAVSSCTGLPVTFSVTASGGGTLTYSWQSATNSTFTTGLTTLSNTGVYSGTSTNTLSISDNTGLDGRYYRVIVSNSAGSTTSSGVLLTVSTPALSTGGTVTQTAASNGNMYYGASCALVCKVVPSGASQVSGNVTSQVWVEASVPTYASTPFVQRHYQITPATSASTATATVTLYFTQAEFNNFNAAAGSTLNLPTGSSDAAGKANLRVGKYAGSSSNGSGLPGTYPGPVTIIDPVDANIIYNSTFSRWEVTFDVSGFSGFVIQTVTAPLPIDLLSFTAQLNKNDVQLKWQTSSETDNDHFDIERSFDGSQFTVIGQRTGAVTTTLVSDYDFTDAGAGEQNTSKLYYRLKTVSTSGQITYSKILIVPLSTHGAVVTGIQPNPFGNELNIGVNAAQSGQMDISIIDMTGRLLIRRQLRVLKGFSTQSIKNLQSISKGIYTLVVNFNGSTSSYKIIK